jgi:hypothetical protein
MQEVPMVRLIEGAGGTIAAIAAAMLVSTSVVVLSATTFGKHLIALQMAQAEPAHADQRSTGTSVNRDRKRDALPQSATVQTRNEITAVEVIGVRAASVVYRDRSGNILFQTDPLANVTIVTKNVELPEVTIRETESTEVERIPAENTGSSAPPQGCESAFARPAPESLTRTPSRCITKVPSSQTTNVAGLRG